MAEKQSEPGVWTAPRSETPWGADAPVQVVLQRDQPIARHEDGLTLVSLLMDRHFRADGAPEHVAALLAQREEMRVRLLGAPLEDFPDLRAKLAGVEAALEGETASRLDMAGVRAELERLRAETLADINRVAGDLLDRFVAINQALTISADW